MQRELDRFELGVTAALCLYGENEDPFRFFWIVGRCQIAGYPR